MMRSLYSGVSGLKNHQTRMDVVGNNISNVNTTGFKSSRVTFSDTLSQTLSGASAPADGLGGTNPKQIGLGSSVSAIDTLFTDGSVQSTGVNTDLCLSGNGLFMVSKSDSASNDNKDGKAGTADQNKKKSSGEVYYTRNGNFKFDANGCYVNSDGLKVQGWCADKPGDTYKTDINSIRDITIRSGETMPSAATKETKFMNNLNSAEATINSIKATDAKGNNLTAAANNTDTWACGGTYKSEITAMQVGFKGTNMKTTGNPTGPYAIGQHYAFDGALTGTGTNGDIVTIPKTLNSKIDMSKSLSSYTVNSVNGTTINLSNGCTINNRSGSNYTVNFSNRTNGDVISPALFTATSANANYTVNNNITLNVEAVNGNQVTLKDPNTNQTYILTNTSGDTYWNNQGTTPTVPPGSTLRTTVTVSIDSIIYNSSASLSNIQGQVNGDAVAMTTGSIVPADGVTISSLNLTNKDGTLVEVSNKDASSYEVGNAYESTIKSITLEMSDKTTSVETSGAFVQGYSRPLTTIVSVYDSLGNAHSVVLYLTKTRIDSNDGNQWTASVNPDGSGKQVLQGSDGKETTVRMDDIKLQFDTNGGFVIKQPGDGKVILTLTNGAKDSQEIEMNFTGLIQYSGSNTAYASADGHASGTLKTISIDSKGVITGTYTNGLSVARGQVAIAQFNNASGLTKTGNSLYAKSNNSGEAQIGTVSAKGCTITPSALEMSNVDMASELTDMIVTQRGYQSNSKIITVSDELLETLINMKR